MILVIWRLVSGKLMLWILVSGRLFNSHCSIVTVVRETGVRETGARETDVK